MPQPAAPGTSVSARAPGKINLFLRVGPRGDNGYHDLVTCFHAVDVWETVTLAPAEATRVTISGDVNLGEVPLDDNNLVVKATRRVADRLGVDQPLHIHIDKRVPVGGGMGGGSADAAAALLAADALWQGGLTPDELLELAASLGADIPFTLEGMSQIGRGNGSLLTPMRSLPLWWVIVPSIDTLSTPAVFAELDEQRSGHQIALDTEVPAGFEDALARGDAEALAGFLRNDLQIASISLKPDLAQTLERGGRLGALASLVSGSGPTCVMLARGDAHAASISADLADEGVFSLVASSPVRGAHLV